MTRLETDLEYFSNPLMSQGHAARLETLTNKAFDIHQYHIAVTIPLGSMLSSAILPTEAHCRTKRFNHTA